MRRKLYIANLTLLAAMLLRTSHHVAFAAEPTPEFTALLFGLIIYTAAYIAEVVRAGILAVAKGQTEAARALGLQPGRVLRLVVLPQALRIVVPSLGNFFVSIFKDSALVSVITMRDLMFSGQILAAATFKHFEIFAMVAVLYLLISYPAAKLVESTHSNVDLANEALSEAQQRFHAGVSDNLPVSQAQSQTEQANDQYISALYQHNVAKLSLARALGVAQTNYKDYLGGK